jgi:hypothetical protein
MPGSLADLFSTCIYVMGLVSHLLVGGINSPGDLVHACQQE